MFIGAGAVILMVMLLVFLVAKYYKTCEMDEALVRSGRGGARVAIQGGIWVFPIIHQMQRVTLRTLKLNVETDDKKHGMGVMRTSDHLPIIINTEIYVRIPRKEEYVIAAATTLGEKADPKARLTGSRGVTVDAVADYEEDATKAISNVVKQKLISSIRGVAATMTLGEMHGNQLGFADKVADILEQDLKENGLELETVSIESIDQEPLTSARLKEGAEGNIFDANAVTALVTGIQQAETRRNAVERDEQVTRKTKDTEYEKRRLDLDQEFVYATEEQQRAVENKKVEMTAEIDKFEAETNRAKVELVEQNQLTANKTIEQAAMELEVFQGECEKDKAVQIAHFELEFQTEELERDRAVEKLEENVMEDIRMAEITRVQNVGSRAIQSKQVVGVGLEQAERAIEVAGVERQETREVRTQEMEVAVRVKEQEVANAATSTNRARAAAAEAEQAIETAAERERQRAMTVIPAEIAAVAEVRLKEQRILEAEKERDAVVLAAEGEKLALELAAQGEVAQAEGTRDADVARGQGADALLVLGRAEAERDLLKNQAYIVEREAELLNDDTVVKYLFQKNLPELAKILPPAIEAAFKPLESIEGMRILQVNTNGGGGSGDNPLSAGDDNPLSNIMRNLVKNAPAIPVLNELLQFGGSKTTVQELVEKVAGGAVNMVADMSAEVVGDVSTDTNEAEA
jgi:uncharacterized membrane protein YqiK